MQSTNAAEARDSTHFEDTSPPTTFVAAAVDTSQVVVQPLDSSKLQQVQLLTQYDEL